MLHLNQLAHTFGAQELRYLDLGDARLDTRAAFMLDQLMNHPESPLPDAMESPAATKGAYRLLENPHVSAQAIRQAHRDRTLDRLRPLPQVLFIQDTTELNYHAHPATTGLGPTGCPTQHGLFVHSTLACAPTGQPLGLVDQEILIRDPATRGTAKDRRKRALDQKESVRWLHALTCSHQDVSPAIETITIADREADFYAFVAHPRGPHAHLLIRATHNRAVTPADAEPSYLWDAMARVVPEAAPLAVTIPRGHADAPPRTAVLEVRISTLRLHPPHTDKSKRASTGVWVQAILVTERDAPAEGEPIVWLLLTTLPVPDLAAAAQCLRWYTLRWLIERFHYILKSGCTIEHLQLESAAALLRAQAFYSIMAWRVLELTYLGRTEPDAPCTRILSEAEWRVLAAAAQPTAPVPTTPPPMRQAVRWLAQLGGFQGRKGDGDPGPKTLWRGLRKLQAMMKGYYIAQQIDHLLPFPNPA